TPQYICVGDLNNDNRTDIASANGDDNSVGVFLGHGNGTFATMTTYFTGSDSQPWWIALGDVNNDTVLDIISANKGSDTIGILLGNGDGTFAPTVTYSTGIGSTHLSVAVGDINNDNNLDLVAASENGNVIIFLGDGNGTFIIWNVLSTDQHSMPF